MKPYGPLMAEHRVIERFVNVLRKEAENIRSTGKVHQDLINKTIDFFRNYADKLHHGKEEDILFRELAKKDISGDHKEIMNRLVDEHVIGRETVGKLEVAEHNYEDGNTEEIHHILEFVDKLDKMYPAHIELEDKHFFLEVMKYFSPEEQEAMGEEMMDFDKKQDIEKYKQMVKELEQ